MPELRKINSKKVLDGIRGQCYMAFTPCLEGSEVGGKPVDVESTGFFFVMHTTRILNVYASLKNFTITNSNRIVRNIAVCD